MKYLVFSEFYIICIHKMCSFPSTDADWDIVMEKVTQYIMTKPESYREKLTRKDRMRLLEEFYLALVNTRLQNALGAEIAICASCGYGVYGDQDYACENDVYRHTPDTQCPTTFGFPPLPGYPNPPLAPPEAPPAEELEAPPAEEPVGR